MGVRVGRGRRSGVAADAGGRSSRTFDHRPTGAGSDSTLVVNPVVTGVELNIDLRPPGTRGSGSDILAPDALAVGLGAGEPDLLRRFGLHRIAARAGRKTPVVLHRLRAASKRAFDIAVSLIVIMALAPIWIVIAAAVAATSRGPIIYRQERVGRNGRSFQVLKFRSMVADAAEKAQEMALLAQEGHMTAVDAPAFKSADDPRVTAVGRFLRRTSLDELPQFLNVVMGHMSLVGPRPLVPIEWDALPDSVVDVLQDVRPGITCLWQVLRYDGMPFQERIELDVAYVRRHSLVLDLALLALTPVAILAGEGAY